MTKAKTSQSPKNLAILALLISVVALFPALFFKQGGGTSTGPQVLEKIRTTGVLRCGYFVEPPYLEYDQSAKKPVGIIPDLLDAVAKYADIKIEWTQELALGSMIEDLNLGKFDMVCGSLFYNPVRSKRALLLEPFAYAPVYAVVRSDETRLTETLGNLNDSDLVVTALDGEGPTLTAQARFPKPKRFSLPQQSDVSMLMETVASKKADVTFVSPQVFFNYDKSHPGKLKILSHQHPMMISPVSFMVREDAQDMANFINQSIQFLDGLGILDEIYAKYDPTGKLFLRPAKTYQVTR